MFFIVKSGLEKFEPCIMKKIYLVFSAFASFISFISCEIVATCPSNQASVTRTFLARSKSLMTNKHKLLRCRELNPNKNSFLICCHDSYIVVDMELATKIQSLSEAEIRDLKMFEKALNDMLEELCKEIKSLGRYYSDYVPEYKKSTSDTKTSANSHKSTVKRYRGKPKLDYLFIFLFAFFILIIGTCYFRTFTDHGRNTISIPSIPQSQQHQNYYMNQQSPYYQTYHVPNAPSFNNTGLYYPYQYPMSPRQ